MIEITESNNRKHYFEETEIKSKCKSCKNVEMINNIEFNYGIIMRYYKNGVFKIIYKYEIISDNEQINNEENIGFSKEILRAINDYSTVTSVDASVKRYYMGLCWIISNKMNKTEKAEEFSQMNRLTTQM